ADPGAREEAAALDEPPAGVNPQGSVVDEATARRILEDLERDARAEYESVGDPLRGRGHAKLNRHGD
ncbi:MAG: hypothetical protein M3680_03775, partial [Myxococcota bacterium]|nr:hypothetical protein [Myxococcota bacterium]